MSSRGKWFLGIGIFVFILVVVGAVYMLVQNLASADVSQNGGCKLDSSTSGCVYSKFKIYPDKAYYLAGETVSITMENTSTKSIFLPNSAPWMVLDSAGDTVFEPARTEAKTEIKAGEKLSWNWDQKTSTSVVADPGRYGIKFFDKLSSKSRWYNLSSYGNKVITVGYAYVEIRPTAITDLSSATTIYPAVSGETVYFGLANTTSAPITFTDRKSVV